MGLRSLLDPGDWLAMKPRLDPDAEPLEFYFHPPRAEVKLRFIVGGTVAAIASLAGYLLRDEGVALVVMGGFAFFGLLNVVYGALQSGFSMSVMISRLEVAVERNTLFGRRHWRESLHSYQGVLLREEELEDHGSGSISIPKRYFIVELLHADPSKTAPLYVSEEGEAPTAIQQAFARRFHLPALAHDISGAVSPESLRRTEDPGPPPPGVVVYESGGVTCLAIGHSRSWRWVPWLVWAAFPLGIGWLVHQILPEMALIAGGMAAGLALVLIAAGLLMERARGHTPRGLCVGRDSVWLGTPDQPPQLAIPFASIRQIRLDRVRGQAREGHSGMTRVIIDGGNQRLELAGGLFDRSKVEWIRNRALYLVSKHR